jgi:hypothetical protein
MRFERRGMLAYAIPFFTTLDRSQQRPAQQENLQSGPNWPSVRHSAGPISHGLVQNFIRRIGWSISYFVLEKHVFGDRMPVLAPRSKRLRPSAAWRPRNIGYGARPGGVEGPTTPGFGGDLLLDTTMV